jgi:hypothetical protein
MGYWEQYAAAKHLWCLIAPRCIVCGGIHEELLHEAPSFEGLCLGCWWWAKRATSKSRQYFHPP